MITLLNPYFKRHSSACFSSRFNFVGRLDFNSFFEMLSVALISASNDCGCCNMSYNKTLYWVYIDPFVSENFVFSSTIYHWCWLGFNSVERHHIYTPPIWSIVGINRMLWPLRPSNIAKICLFKLLSCIFGGSVYVYS